MTKMPAWTYSQLDKFETCAKQYYHTKVARDVVEGDTDATIWGTKVHTAFENAMIHNEVLPEGMKHWQSIADKFARLPGEKLVEYKFSIDRNFEPAPWGAAWSRGIADLVVRHKKRVLIADWKTGKKKPTEQLDLYAGYVMAEWPDTEVIQTAFVWLKEKKMTKKTMDAATAVPVIWQGFIPRTRRLERAYEQDTWPAKPSGLCKLYCPVLSCGYNGRK
jgi:PD-(D/E)XK nuclease superfamily